MSNPVDLIMYEYIYRIVKFLIGAIMILFVMTFTLTKLYYIDPNILPPFLRKRVKKWIRKRD